MPIFISMIMWICLMRMLCSSRIKASRLSGGVIGYKVSTMVSVVTMGYIVFWMGIHTWMADSTAYIIDYNRLSTEISDIPALIQANAKGALWTASMILIKGLISEDFHVWFFILAITMGFSVSYFYRKYSEFYFFSMLLFIFTRDMTYMYNGMRQFLAIALLLLAFPWLLKGKTIKYITLIAILSLIHYTVWIMLPIYFIVRCKPWGKITTLASIAMCLICFYITPFAEAVETCLQSTHYAEYSLISADDDGMHPLRAIVALIPLIFAWFMRKQLAEENNQLLNVCINMCLMCTLLSLFAVFTSGILMGRLTTYCEIYTTIAIPTILQRLRNKSLRKSIIISCIIGYAVYFYVNTCDEVYYSDLTGRVSL